MTFAHWKAVGSIWSIGMAVLWAGVFAATFTGSFTVGFHGGAFQALSAAAAISFTWLLAAPHHRLSRAGSIAFPILASGMRVIDFLFISGARGGINWLAVAAWSLQLFAMIFALAFFIGLFMILPLLIARGAETVFGESTILFNVVDGLVRVLLFIGYIWAIGLSKEIRRVFAYHGAEHKTIYAFEDGKPLAIDQIQPYSPRHPRCGTNFLMIVIVIALIVFTALGRPAWPWLITSRVVGIPIIAGIAYEILKLGAERRWMRYASMPGVWLQYLTTREPDDDQVEVAVASLLAALDEDERREVEERGPIASAALEAEFT